MNIGLFFGTFNPVHIGHMAIAGYMSEFTELEQVWFVLTPHNPLKEKKGLLSDHHRLALLRVAVENNSRRLKVSDVELKLSQPSYTIHTLVHLEERYPGNTFSLIMGSDNLEHFHKWKNYEEILARYDLYIYPRNKPYEGQFKDHPRIHFTNAPLMEISSTFIRNAIKAKRI